MCNANNATTANPDGSGCVGLKAPAEPTALGTIALICLLVPMGVVLVVGLSPVLGFGPKKLRGLVLNAKDGRDRS